jgi:hypothetical protein
MCCQDGPTISLEPNRNNRKSPTYDNGTHNILLRADRAVSGWPIAGIDFDEQRLPVAASTRSQHSRWPRTPRAG